MAIEWTRRLPRFEGQTISTVVVGQDNGYDFMAITTDEGDTLIIMEDGQAVWCKLIVDDKSERVSEMAP